MMVYIFIISYIYPGTHTIDSVWRIMFKSQWTKSIGSTFHPHTEYSSFNFSPDWIS